MTNIDVTIPQITMEIQKQPVTLSDGEQKDLRKLINAAITGKTARISQQRLYNLKYRLAK